MDELGQKIKEYSPYLQDLFRRIYILTIFFIIFFIAGFFLSTTGIRYITKIFNFKDVVLATTTPFQLIDLAMNTGISLAIILSTPLFLYHLYSFIDGGLRKHEKKAFFFFLPLSLLLFSLGFAYSFYILYFTMQTLADINTSLGVSNLWNISSFLTQIILTSALLGILFQFPLVITILVKLDVLSLNILKNKRRHAVLAMFALASLLPPTDGISLLVMVLPLIVMYEFTIIYNELTSRQLKIL